ncbi:Holliday junction branch migration protein RuvA [Facilibium subflavum]|uniref:Holliday junction branch migration protein RuvA n=1 Tax=Facilibium subflavum TaxID=2219058 RepID=UPI000E64FC06|nr:Holliday junction branch migration protein RuvA [Facilibium subflavum]
MIGRIKGELLEKQPPMLLVETYGIGYEILAPMTSIYTLGEVGNQVVLYTHFVVREDAQQLYGFATKSDRRLFQELIKINGIGAKMALAILSGMDGKTLIHCIESQDHGLLCSIPGIGKKTAERLIIDIKDKINKLSLELHSLTGDNAKQLKNSTIVYQVDESLSSTTTNNSSSIISEAIHALESLGYKTKDAQSYVYKVKHQACDNVEDLIRLALKTVHQARKK